jgi:hypothetical protein
MFYLDSVTTIYKYMLDAMLNVHVILGLNASLGTFTCNVSAVLALQMLSWDNLAYTTPHHHKDGDHHEDGHTNSDRDRRHAVCVRGADSYVLCYKEEKPHVDPISHVVLCLGVIAGLAGALVAARRK